MKKISRWIIAKKIKDGAALAYRADGTPISNFDSIAKHSALQKRMEKSRKCREL